MRKVQYALFITVLLVLTVNCLPLVTSVYAVNTKTLYPIEDTFVNSDLNTTSYNGNSLLLVGNNTDYWADPLAEGVRIMFFKFNLTGVFDEVDLESDEEIVIEDISFKAYNHKSYGTHYLTAAYTLNQTWQDITYADYPSIDETELSEDVEVTSDDEDTWDVWSYMEVSDTITEYIENNNTFTVAITPGEYTGYSQTYRSLEYGGISYDPRLVIEYSIETVGEGEAEVTISLTNVPVALGNALGVGSFAGGILASSLLLFAFMLPIGLFADSPFPSLIMGVLLLSLSVALGWLPVWVLLIIGLLVAALYSDQIQGWMAGG